MCLRGPQFLHKIDIIRILDFQTWTTLEVPRLRFIINYKKRIIDNMINIKSPLLFCDVDLTGKCGDKFAPFQTYLYKETINDKYQQQAGKN
jgi:hypothetical protein